jgi:hypothetical protein
MSEDSPSLNQICFVLSPIGREGTETYQRFREALEFVIKPAVNSAGSNLKVTRADDIERPGSFIKDILEYITTKSRCRTLFHLPSTRLLAYPPRVTSHIALLPVPYTLRLESSHGTLG